MPTPRSNPRRAATGVLLALLAATLMAVTAPGAGAAVIAASRSGFEGGPVLAADGRVVVGERGGNGALRIIAIDPRTQEREQLAAFGPLADATTYPDLSLTGSGGIVTASVDTYRQAPDPFEENASATLLASRTMTIAPSALPLTSCAGGGLQRPPRLEAAGGADFVATVGDECANLASVVRIRTTDGTLAIPAAAGPDGAPRQITDLRAAGPLVAWLEKLPTLVGPAELVVARAATGQVLLRTLVDGFGYQIGSEGTVVTPDFFACGMRVLVPGSPAPRAFKLPARLCSIGFNIMRGQSNLAVAAGRIVYPTAFGFGVTDLNGVAHALAEATARDSASRSPVAFDGRTAFVKRVDCDADRLLAVDAAIVAPIPAPPTSQEPCPVRRSGSGRLRIAPDGRVGIRLRCPAGCRGTLRLVQQRRGRRERLVGRAAYQGAAGSIVVKPRIARYARALAGCSGGLRVEALLTPAGDDLARVVSKSFGPYRLVARTRCRHAGGPPFKARPVRPGPRP